MRVDRPGLAGAGPAHGAVQGLGAGRGGGVGAGPGRPRPGSPRWWWRASRPGTGGGCWTRSPPSTGCALVCVQPLLVARAREAEDFTRNKNDDVDAMIIARLVTELRCYLPERADPTWARLRHLGRPPGRAGHRRPARPASRCATCSSAPGRRCWTPPAKPLDVDELAGRGDRRCWTGSAPAGDLGVIRRWGWDRFAAAVRAELRLPPAGTPRSCARCSTPRPTPRAGRGRGRRPARRRAGAGAVRLADLAHAARRDGRGRGPDGRGARRSWV